MQRILKIKHHSTFHVRSRTVLWLVLMLKVLHEITVTVKLFQDIVQVRTFAKHVGTEIELKINRTNILKASHRRNTQVSSLIHFS